MKRLIGVSRVSDDDLRTAVNKLSDDEKENVIQKLWVSHARFQNWLDGKDKLVNSKKRNQLIHILEIAV